MEKKVEVKGTISAHQWGVVQNRGGWREPYRHAITSTHNAQSVNVVGGIGETERANRDNMRVLHRKGSVYTLKSHIDKDHPLVLKKWKRDAEQ